ncbi:MAG TPA: hypothetical protein VMU75_01645 [Acidimicrobiales bacterium]|nr:hypothetical protein [Acidimicrobiales bacterium]
MTKLSDENGGAVDQSVLTMEMLHVRLRTVEAQVMTLAHQLEGHLPALRLSARIGEYTGRSVEHRLHDLESLMLRQASLADERLNHGCMLDARTGTESFAEDLVGMARDDVKCAKTPEERQRATEILDAADALVSDSAAPVPLGKV